MVRLPLATNPTVRDSLDHLAMETVMARLFGSTDAWLPTLRRRRAVPANRSPFLL